MKSLNNPAQNAVFLQSLSNNKQGTVMKKLFSAILLIAFLSVSLHAWGQNLTDNASTQVSAKSTLPDRLPIGSEEVFRNFIISSNGINPVLNVSIGFFDANQEYVEIYFGRT